MQNRDNKSLISFNADLVPSLEGLEGQYEVIQGNQSYHVKCEDIPGHSPVITSLVPTGHKICWVITKSETQATETDEREQLRSRAASSAR